MLKRFLKPEMRYARRMARIERWNQPMDGPWDRVRAWTHMLLVDHGVFRMVYLNRHRVSMRLWRSGQPAPHHIAQLAAEGVRTIINLRGGREHGSWPLERESCERHGIDLVEFVVRSREAPSRESIVGAKAFFDRYRLEGEPRGLSLVEWVEREYDPEALARDFRPRFWSELLADRIMRRE